MTQAAIADNKALGPVLADIQRRQQDRDAHTLATKRLSLREEDLMRRNMGEVGLPGRRSYGRPTIRDKALARMAGVAVSEPTGNVVNQLVAQTVRRLKSLRPAESEPSPGSGHSR